MKVTTTHLSWLNELPGNPLVVAEIKEKSPFNPAYKAPHRYHQFEICEEVGDIISVHTNPDWGGSFEWLAEVRKMTIKPILAKGFHPSIMDVQRALDNGADYVLTVGWCPESDYDARAKIWHECESIHELLNSPAGYRVWNVRNPRTGAKRLVDIDYVYEKMDGDWLCRASCISGPEDVRHAYNAVLIGEGLYKSK